MERVAMLLPQEQRERFLALSMRLKTLPEDDEFLLALELICFSTLIWHQVPGRLQQILEKSNPVSENTHSIAGQLKEAIIREIPSCEDLRHLSIRLAQHEKNLKSELRQLQRERKAVVSRGWPLLFLGLILGCLADRFVSLPF